MNSAIKNTIIYKVIKTNEGPLAALILLVVAISFASPYFLTYTNLTSVARQISTTALVTFGVTFCLISGSIDLSVGSTVAFSGCVMVILMKGGMNFWLAMPIGILSGGLIGLINGLIIAFSGITSFIVTLSTANIVRGFAYILTGGLPAQVKNDALYSLGKDELIGIPIPIIIVFVLLIISIIILNKTVFGRNLYACGGNRDAAIYSGISIKKTTIAVFIITGLLSAVGGIITSARVNSGQPSAAMEMPLDAIAAAVIGGVAFTGGGGTIIGTTIGILILGVLNNAMNLLDVSFFEQLIVKGVVLLIAVYIDSVKKMRENRV